MKIWRAARELCKFIHKLTEKEPFCKDYKFRYQIRASSGSVMDNIAEGFERDGNKEFVQFLSVSKGSCGETRSQSYRAIDYKYISQDIFNEPISQITQLSKNIASFITYLKNSEFRGSKYHISEP